MKKIIPILFLAISSLSAMNNEHQHATNNLKEAVKLFFLPKINHYIARPCTNYLLQTNPALYKDASKEYQQLHLQAQETLGIAKELSLPLKKIDALNPPPFFIPGAIGLTLSDVILIDESRLENKSDSVKKYIMLHENAHAKHFDAAKLFWLLPSWVSSYLGAKYLFSKMRQKPFKFGHIGPLGSGIASIIYLVYRSPFKETRADFEAYNALNCHHCVRDCVDEAPSDRSMRDSFRREFGYLTQEKVTSIAKEFEKENKVCENHKNQKQNTRLFIYDRSKKFW